MHEAQLLLQNGATEGACSRAYYAMYDAAHALLIATGHEKTDAMIKTHDTLIGVFGQKMVLGGLVDAAFGRALNKAQDIRLLADYSGEPPPLAEAKWVVGEAEAFVTTMRAIFLVITSSV